MAREVEMPPVGEALALGDAIRRVLAPNPGPMTFWGTNSYILGAQDVVVIDPGPDDEAHRDALLAALKGARVHAIVVTHAHLDHSAGARALAEATDAPVYGYGPPEAGRSEVMERFAASGAPGGGEGVDQAFLPDITLPDRGELHWPEGVLTAIHTPGHFGGHLSFCFGGVVFTGDLIMGWSTTLISPPDGDVSQFLASCARLGEIDAKRFLPGHGAPVETPADRISWLVAHRREREVSIRKALARAPHTARQIAEIVYDDLAPSLLPAAERNVLAHLLDLADRGLASAPPACSSEPLWRLT